MQHFPSKNKIRHLQFDHLKKFATYCHKIIHWCRVQLFIWSCSISYWIRKENEMKALYEKPVTSKQYLHHWMIEYSHTIKILIHWTTVKLERQYLLFQFINNSLINQSSFNWVLKVMWDCFVSSLLCSVISPENVHYSLNQSDVKIKQICPTMLTIQCVKIN